MKTGNICLLPEPQIAVVYGEVKDLHGFIFERKLDGLYDRIPLLGDSLVPGKSLHPDAEEYGLLYCICPKSAGQKRLTPDNLLCMEKCGALESESAEKTSKDLRRFGVDTKALSHDMKLRLVSRIFGDTKILQIEVNGTFWRELGDFWPMDVYKAVHVFKALGSTIPNLDMQDGLEEEEQKMARAVKHVFSNMVAYGGDWRFVCDEEFVFDGKNSYRESDPWSSKPQTKEEFRAMIERMEEEQFKGVSLPPATPKTVSRQGQSTLAANDDAR